MVRLLGHHTPRPLLLWSTLLSMLLLSTLLNTPSPLLLLLSTLLSTLSPLPLQTGPDSRRRRGIALLVLDPSNVPPALLPAQPPLCVGASASVGPRFIFPDPRSVPDHDAVPVQDTELVTDPARAALTLLLRFAVAILDCELQLDLASLQLRVQARAVVLEVLKVADLKASQVWGKAVYSSAPEFRHIGVLTCDVRARIEL